MYIQFIGPLCGGKSTLATLLSENGKAEVYFEPKNEAEIYKLFMADKIRYAFANQLYFYKATYEKEQAIAKSEAPFVIQDSGLLVCHHIYSELLREQHYLGAAEFENLLEMYNLFIKNCRQPDGIVFLTADLFVLTTRLLARDKTLVHNLTDMVPYWERLIRKVNNLSIPVLALDSSTQSTTQLIDSIFNWVKTI